MKSLDGDMRICNVCKEDLPKEAYHKCKSFPLGITYTCKVCAKKKSIQWNKENKERKAKHMKIYYENTYREKLGCTPIEELRVMTEEELKLSRKASILKYGRKRKKVQRKTMHLSQFDDEFIDLFFSEVAELAVSREKTTGVKWHLDHVIPMFGKTVSGLHIPENLQLITEKENLCKSNVFGY